MAHTLDIPTDSVLRRHFLTEQGRTLGLPPSDSVLQRHYAQLTHALSARAAAPSRPAATPAAALKAATPVQAAPVRQPAPSASAAAPAAARARVPETVTAAAQAAAPAVRAAAPVAQPASGGGFFGWLRRLVGGR